MQERSADQNSRGSQIVRFADFEVDLRAGELRRGSARIRLQDQPFQVLTILLQHPGDIVSREELCRRLWSSDTFVDFDNSLNTAINKIREALGDSAEDPHFVETLPRRGYRFIARLEGNSAGPIRTSKTEKPSSGKQAGAIDSLAVLPLENVSGDPETEYLSDGIAETLINSLAQLRKIRVVPRTLSFRYRGAAVDLLKAGRELGVRAVLAGRMMQRGDGLIVSVELVDVDRQAQVWGNRYNRKMIDLIVLQEELTGEIAEKLRLQLTGDENKRLRKRPTQNNEAFRLVLQAQHYISGVSPEGLSKGIALCQQAIDIDPAYAAAYARISFARSIQYVWAYTDSAEVAPRMVAAAKKALELDDTLADSHVGMGWSLFWTWDFAGAEREARRGVELNPDATEAWSLLDLVVLSLGRFEEAIAAGKRAVEVAPLDYYSSFALGVTYLHAQQFENAIEQQRKTADIDPGSPAAHGALAHAYASAGQYKAAIDECELALALNRKDAFLVMHAATGYAMAGEAGEARKLVEEVEKNWKADGASAFWLAAVHAYLGEKDTAFEWLERAFKVRAPFLVFLKIMWTHHLLRGDPRFNALAKRIGIPD
jgi:TolB-like protein/Flp pilus assembly protein TadD